MLPEPTPKQARILWASLTAMAVAILIALLGCLLWGFGYVINRLSAVLLPLAIAGVVACLLDPVVGFLEKRRSSRIRAILMVFLLAVFLVLLLLSTVVPQLVHEAGELIQQTPAYITKLRTQFAQWSANSPTAQRAQELWTIHGETAQAWLTSKIPILWGWLLANLSKAASWFGLLIGLFLVPVYTFYFLVEKAKIEKSWTLYLPMRDSKWKDELIFVIRSVNQSLVVFFRGQVLVALCVGTLTAVGFFLIQLKYALLLGVLTGVLGIIPYLGVMVSIVPAICLAIVQFGDWRVLLVVLVFVLVQMAEGLVISPKIIGDRVGLHPLTIIIAVMVGTALMGGILGGILAIPFTAALRTLMFRYIWRRRNEATGSDPLSVSGGRVS